MNIHYNHDSNGGNDHNNPLDNEITANHLYCVNKSKNLNKSQFGYNQAWKLYSLDVYLQKILSEIRPISISCW